MIASMRGLRMALAVGVMVIPSTAMAHEIHTTMTVVTASPTGVTFTVRSFADDFSASVARHAGRAVPRDSSVRAIEVTRYVQSQLQVHDASGRVLALEACGIRRQGELYFACFRVRGVSSLEGLRVRNRILTETHADQVNIVQVEGRGARRTLLFTRASAPAVLSSRT